MFKSLGLARRGSRRGRARRQEGAGAGRRHRGRLLIGLAEIERARETIAGAAIRTPLVRLEVDAPAEIWLKLENLQPIGSFKIRGAVNAIRSAPARGPRNGVVTVSAGNMAQGVAWAARELGVPATIVAPEQAPQTKLDAIERLGGRVVKVPYERWWEIMTTSRFDGAEGLFVHPVQDERGDGRQRHDRARAGRGPAGRRCRARSLGRRRALHRDRDRARCRQPRYSGLRRPARDGSRRQRRARGREPTEAPGSRPRSWTAPAPRSSCR